MSVSAPVRIPTLAEIDAELARRNFAGDPNRWLTERMGEFAWSKQREIMDSVKNNRKTAVHSCHESGKSFIAARVAAWWIDSHPPGEAFVVSSAPRAKQVKAILWREINRAHAKGNLPGRMNQVEWLLTYQKPGDAHPHEELVAFGQKPADLDPAAFTGIHARWVLVIFDEAIGMPPLLWGAANSLIANEFSRIMAIGNPDDPATEFARVCKPGSGWNVIKIAAKDTPNFTGEPIPATLGDLLISRTWVAEVAREYGIESAYYKSKVDAEFPEFSTDGLIPMAWVRAAQDRTLEPGPPNRLGVDVGGGTNKSTVCHRRGSVARIIRRTTEPNTMVTCGHVMADLDKTGAELANIDNNGIGKGIDDRAHELASDRSNPQRHIAARVSGVNVGESADDPIHFANRRAEGYWGLRQLFQDGLIDIDPDDDNLAAQLVEIKYKTRSNGQIVIESKEDMRARGVMSPDDADALMLAFIKDRHIPRAGAWGPSRGTGRAARRR